MNTDLIPTTEAAKKLGYTLQHTRLLIRNQRINATKVGRDWLISPKEILGFLAQKDDKEIASSRKPIKTIHVNALLPKDNACCAKVSLRNQIKLLRKLRKYYISNDSSVSVSRKAAYELLESIGVAHEKFLLTHTGNTDMDHYIKKSAGVFLTPYHVAKRIVECAIAPKREEILSRFHTLHSIDRVAQEYESFLELNVIDPACGTGIILAAAVESLLNLHYSIVDTLANRNLAHKLKLFSPEQYLDHLILHKVYGIDIDPHAVEITRVVLSTLFASKPGKISSKIMVGDALQIESNLFALQDTFSSLSPIYGRGFNLIVMNPPYERLKLDHPELGNMSSDKDYYEKRKKALSDLVSYIRNSGNFPLSAHGVLDMYKIFVDLALRLASQNGSIGFIVPLTILGDRSAAELRKYILSNCSLHSVDCIPEQVNLFHGVAQAFCIMAMQKAGHSQTFEMRVHNNRLMTNPKVNKISVSGIRTLCGQHYPIPSLDKAGWRVLEKICVFRKLGELPFIKNLRGELDLTAYSDCISETPTRMRLIRGDMIKPFSVEIANSNKKSYVQYDKFLEKIKGSSKVCQIDRLRIAGQQISNLAQLRRLKFGLVKGCVLSNSCNFITVEGQPEGFSEKWLLTLLNSALLNWRFKITSTNNHVNNYELDELPLAPLSTKFSTAEISSLVEAQVEEFSDETQSQIDAIVFASYQLNEEDALTVLSSQLYGKDYISLVLKALKENTTCIV